MTLAEREIDLIERYTIIEDRHERLNAIISHRVTGRNLANSERRDEWLVQGCSSQVWLTVAIADGKLDARFAADSVMVKGLVALLVELYHGAEVAEVRKFSPRLIQALELDRMLSGTRLHGLAQVILTFQKAAHVD